MIRDMATRFPPWEVFTLLDTRQRVFVVKYVEHLDKRRRPTGEGSMVVAVREGLNGPLFHERDVAGITADMLEPARDDA